MSRDTIVDEVRRAREDYARKFKFDLHAICDDLRKQEMLSGGPVVSLPKRPPVATLHDGDGPTPRSRRTSPQ
jgi:hypothetical protein